MEYRLSPLMSSLIRREVEKMLKRTLFFTALLAILVLTLSSISFAADKGSIELKAVVEKEIQVVNEKGEKVLKRVPAEKVIPGEEVIYTIVYENIGAEPAGGIVITNPIPEHMIYTHGSAIGIGTDITFSIDGGISWDKPENLKIKEADGTIRLAKTSEYTHIRWKLGKKLIAGGKGDVNYRAKLE